MSRAAVFVWTGDLPPDESLPPIPPPCRSTDYGERWAYHATAPVAATVLASLRELRYETGAGVPIFGANAGHFDLRLGGTKHSVTVQCVGRGGRKESFAAEVSVRRERLASLFGKPLSAEADELARTSLHAALSTCPQVADLAWVEDPWMESPTNGRKSGSDAFSADDFSPFPT